MCNDLATSNYFIIYFDILGYKNILLEGLVDEKSLIEGILNLIEKTKEEIAQVVYRTQKDIKVKTFSDNIIFFFKDKYSDDSDTDWRFQSFLAVFTRIIAKIQRHLLLEFKLLIRGAITYGKFYADENIVFGEGLIKAVSLENDAKYPRIILDSKVFGTKNCDSLVNSGYLLKDEDSFYYVDFLSTYEFGDNKNKKMIRDIAEKAKVIIGQLTDKYTQIESIKEKYDWLNAYLVSFCQRKGINYGEL